MRFSSAVRLLTGLGFMSASAMAFAADLAPPDVTPVFVQPPTTGFTVTVGAGPDIQNQFPGAKTVTVLPTFHFDYRKVGDHEPFYTPDDSFDIAVYENQYFRIGPAGNYINDRGLSNGNGNFFGLHHIDGTFELGGFAEIFPVPNHVRVRAELLKGINGSRGLVGNLGGDLFQRLGPFEASIGPRFGFGDQRYVDQYFSVTPLEAALNGRVTPYQAQAGLTSVGMLGTLRYDISRQYSVLGFGGYSRLVDSVEQSPVASVLGTRNQFTAGAVLNYSFNFGGFGILGY